MITLTPTAGEVLKKIKSQENIPEQAALRLGVTTEGCEGSGTQFRYVLDFDVNPAKPQDHAFESEGVRILIDDASLPHVNELQLDVRQEMGSVKFLFTNPKAAHSCGCGHTFSEQKKAEPEAAGHGGHHGHKHPH
ncbi:MAG: iron-sulfur cluster assembly accessory protein [Acidobacteria bacterium]|nr:iron-sulfur cluster assembly accessory protein [Acidobacteriota bacterium]